MPPQIIHLPCMKQTITLIAGVLAAQLAVCAVAHAQAQTAPAYNGPRYPGGPDSLRALVYRSTRLANPAPTGKVLVLVELDADGRPVNFKLVMPPAPTNIPLLESAGTAVTYLQERMLTWQPATPEPKAKYTAEPPQTALVLDFSSSALDTRPYSYAEQLPQFPALAKLLGPQQLQYVDPPLTDPVKQAAFISSAKGLGLYTQMQVRYPPEALRYQQEGRVHVSFEVAETGTIEHVEILGSAGRALDAEVLRVVQRLPAAGSPALLQGRPVRLHYALPITFKIQ